MNLVTGATGMLGIHVMLELLKRGESVRGLRRSQSDLTHAEQVFEFYQKDKKLFSKIEWVDGDVLDIDSLLTAMTGCTNVYHCAAIVSYHRSEWDLMFQVNVEGTENVVNCALEKKIHRFCHISSIAALGKSKSGEWISEDSEWKESELNTHYAISKNLSEMEVWRGVQEGLESVIVNPGIVIGPGNFSRSSASMFTRINEGLDYYPPGGTGFISAKDCARIAVELMQKNLINERYVLVSENLSMKEVFQSIAISIGKKPAQKLASQRVINLARLAEALKEKLTGKKALITKESARNSSLRSYYKNEKLRNALGYEFESVQSVIKETSDFFRSLNDRG